MTAQNYTVNGNPLVCGPYLNTTASVIIQAQIQNNSAANFIYNLISSPIFLICGLVILILFLFFTDDSDKFVAYIKEKDQV
jgi:hypothetical protein